MEQKEEQPKPSETKEEQIKELTPEEKQKEEEKKKRKQEKKKAKEEKLRQKQEKQKEKQKEKEKQPKQQQQIKEKEVEYYTSNAKLIRPNKNQPVYLSETKPNILITSALPYVNNAPHLGTLIGCVMSADVFARFSRLMGKNVLYVCGTDEYGTATETKAMEEKDQKETHHYYTPYIDPYHYYNRDMDKF